MALNEMSQSVCGYTQHSRDREELNTIANQQGLINSHRTLQQPQHRPVLFKCPGTHSRIDGIMNHKTLLNTLHRFEVMQSVFLNPSGIKLDTNNRK